MFLHSPDCYTSRQLGPVDPLKSLCQLVDSQRLYFRVHARQQLCEDGQARYFLQSVPRRSHTLLIALGPTLRLRHS